MRIAIDFGASATKVAAEREGSDPRLVVFAGATEFPTAAYRSRSGELHVGTRALSYANRDATRLVTRIKRVLSSPSSVAPIDRTIALGGKEHEVVDLVAAVFGHALTAARGQDTSEVDLVLTHPVEWGEAERSVLTSAATQAGVTTTPTFVTEPEAAAAFVVAEQLASLSDGAIAVFDLGASTFDAAVVRAAEDGRTTAIASGGRLIGGADIDVAVLDLVAASSSGQAGTVNRLREDPAHVWALAGEARRVKEELSDVESSVFAFEGLDDVEIRREDLEEAIEPLLDSCIATVEQCLTVLPASVRIGALVGTGASVHIPYVQERLAELARAHHAKYVIPNGAVGLGQTIALGALRVIPSPKQIVITSQLWFKLPTAQDQVVHLGKLRFAYGAGTGELRIHQLISSRVSTTMEFGLAVSAVAGDADSGRLLVGAASGCVQVYRPNDEGENYEQLLSPSKSFASFRGERVTAGTIRNRLAAFVKEGKPGGIYQLTSGSWQPGRGAKSFLLVKGRLSGVVAGPGWRVGGVGCCGSSGWWPRSGCSLPAG